MRIKKIKRNWVNFNHDMGVELNWIKDAIPLHSEIASSLVIHNEKWQLSKIECVATMAFLK